MSQGAAPPARRRLLTEILALGLVLCLPGGIAEASRANRAPTRGVKPSPRTSTEAAGARPRSGRAGWTPRFRRRGPGREHHAATPEVQLLARAGAPGTSDPVLVTVRLVHASPALRYVALEVGADPAKLRYHGYLPTGRGGLIVRESPSVPGAITVFRSSLAGGFDPVETVVVLEFDALQSGDVPLALSDVRVLDGTGKDVATTMMVEELHLD